MADLYDAIGNLAAAAHANGDEIDENIYPDKPGNDRHGLDIITKGQFLRLRDVPNEPRFAIESPYTFSPRLRNRYTPSELSQRADVDFPSLSEDGQESVAESVLQTDLETAQKHEADFRAAFQRELAPVDQEILRVTHGDDELWNGVLIRDRLFPYDDSFDTVEYRRAVSRIRKLTVEVSQILTETVPPLNDANDEEEFSPGKSERIEGLIGFQ